MGCGEWEWSRENRFDTATFDTRHRHRRRLNATPRRSCAGTSPSRPARTRYRLATPLHAHDAQPIPRDVAHQRATAIAYWRKIVDHVQIDIPAARDLVDTARANVAYNLLGRDGPAIRGGARNYRRSWIRDGSLASTMLLRFGLDDDVRDYIRWFAPYQFARRQDPLLRRLPRRRSGR